MDEGMPGDVYEVIAGKNNGARSLLRPISETSSWKWHPLFVHTDQQFELLDRKIPAQILLSRKIGECHSPSNEACDGYQRIRIEEARKVFLESNRRVEYQANTSSNKQVIYRLTTEG